MPQGRLDRSASVRYDALVTVHSAILFDLDGTLTRPYLDFDAIRAEIGITGGPILEALSAMDDDARERGETILLRHEAEAATHATLQEGAVHVLATLRSQGFPVGIVTRNARRTVHEVLEAHGIVVDGIRTREDGAIKPSPEAVRSLCEQFGASPAMSWMVGDYLFDVLAGNAAGARTVLMLGDSECPDYGAQADFVIRRLAELLPLVTERSTGNSRRQPRESNGGDCPQIELE